MDRPALKWFRYNMTEKDLVDLYITYIFCPTLPNASKRAMEAECKYLLELLDTDHKLNTIL
jgi:hypothetical protein